MSNLNSDYTDGTKDWDPNTGWSKNFRKFRWLNIVVPILAPVGMISVFLIGYLSFGIAALVLATMAWFEYRKTSRKKYGPIFWTLVAPVAAVWGVWMIVLQFVPQWR